MRAANEMVNVIRELIQQEIDHMDTTVLCEVVSQDDDNHYSVYVLPDRTTVISNIVNMTVYNLSPGDYCYIYKIKNSFANSFVCYKLGVTSAEELRGEAEIIQVINQEYVTKNNSEGSSTEGTTFLVQPEE